MRREVKSLRIGVHHAKAVVREPVYSTHLIRARLFVQRRDDALVILARWRDEFPKVRSIH